MEERKIDEENFSSIKLDRFCHPGKHKAWQISCDNIINSLHEFSRVYSFWGWARAWTQTSVENWMFGFSKPHHWFYLPQQMSSRSLILLCKYFVTQTVWILLVLSRTGTNWHSQELLLSELVLLFCYASASAALATYHLRDSTPTENENWLCRFVCFFFFACVCGISQSAASQKVFFLCFCLYPSIQHIFARKLAARAHWRFSLQRRKGFGEFSLRNMSFAKKIFPPEMIHHTAFHGEKLQILTGICYQFQ